MDGESERSRKIKKSKGRFRKRKHNPSPGRYKERKEKGKMQGIQKKGAETKSGRKKKRIGTASCG
ncbi:hypothetical protein J437_LFUL002631 [Ladona fulva]|uniref:Uncharacterized protein n=1 Tax=Ladona fulva TaxID=123851 RepID=A0A8K0NVF7_LADFU|nr:hypothetical protein J437_LFUL002631 [Ladona fulva]